MLDQIIEQKSPRRREPMKKRAQHPWSLIAPGTLVEIVVDNTRSLSYRFACDHLRALTPSEIIYRGFVVERQRGIPGKSKAISITTDVPWFPERTIMFENILSLTEVPA